MRFPWLLQSSLHLVKPLADPKLCIAGKDPDHERQPGEEREVLPEVKLMAYAACALGVTGAPSSTCAPVMSDESVSCCTLLNVVREWYQMYVKML